MPDIFGSEPLESDETENISLDTLVGDDRKYKSPDELAKAYVNADSYIEKQKRELAERDAELKILRELRDAQLSKKIENSGDNDPPGRQHETPPDPAALKASDVDINKLVREELAQASEEKRRADNINEAAKTMTQRFGSPAKAQEAVRRRAEELGVGVDWLMDSAAKSPSAFYATMGISPTDRSASSPGFRHEVNIERTTSGGLRNFTYWEELRKKSPKTYYSPETQKQLFAARRELGDKFYAS